MREGFLHEIKAITNDMKYNMFTHIKCTSAQALGDGNGQELAKGRETLQVGDRNGDRGSDRKKNSARIASRSASCD
jgi:hypothetical protein